MSYNDVILEGTIIKEPIFYSYQEKEKLELSVMTTEGTYVKDGKTKSVKTFHKVLIYNDYYVKIAKDDVAQKNGKILIKGKLASMVDSDGVYSYCVCVFNSHHYAKITRNYFEYKMNDKKLRDYVQEI